MLKITNEEIIEELLDIYRANYMISNETKYYLDKIQLILKELKPAGINRMKVLELEESINAYASLRADEGFKDGIKLYKQIAK